MVCMGIESHQLFRHTIYNIYNESTENSFKSFQMRDTRKKTSHLQSLRLVLIILHYNFKMCDSIERAHERII